MISAFPPISFCFCPLVVPKNDFYNGLFITNYICGFPFQVNLDCINKILKIPKHYHSLANFVINF